MHRSHRLVRLVAILVLGGLALGVCFVALTPGVATLAASARYSGKVGPLLRTLEDPTILYDMNGVEYDRLGDLDRQPVPLRVVPKIVRQAVIATEDRTFYRNDGVDFRSAVRAFASNVDAGGIAQGGSTITQQLIKNRFFKNPKRNLDRKVREAILAHRLTNEWSKNRILEEYLNTVYFGQNSYGIQAASTRIIGKPNLAELNLAEAALLAGLIKNPTAYDVFANPTDALERRNEVIRRMRVQRGITEADAVAARAAVLPVTQRPSNELRATSAYGEEVLSKLKTLPELGVDAAQRTQAIFSGGLRVYTEYDPRLSYIAFSVITSVIKPAFEPFRAAMAVMEPRTGAVRAVVDGSLGAQGYNLATDGTGRKVGSTFKPITLATAIDNNYSPEDTVDGSSNCRITFPGWNPDKPYIAKNSSESSGGTADLYSQTKNSVNCAYLRLMTSVGPPKVREMATKLGYTHPVGQNLSMGIGETEHTPLEVATVYSTFANDGVKHAPVFVRRIEDVRGRVLYRAPPGVRVLETETARTVTDVLSHVTEGTAKRAALAGRTLAGKTGTTDRQTDAWFAGYTPQLVAAVWMGNKETGDVAKPESWMESVGEFSPVFGGTYPAIIWQQFMTQALQGQPVLGFIAPDKSQWPKRGRVKSDGGRTEFSLDFSGVGDVTTTTVPAASTPTTAGASPPSSASTRPPPPTSTPKPVP